MEICRKVGVATARTLLATRTGLGYTHLYNGIRAASFKVQDLEDFDKRVRKSDLPVVVDFFATWCNPCRLLTPRIESIIAENEGKIHLAKVDIDENTDLALDFDVGSVPVLVAMRNGKVEDKLIGLQDADKLRKWVNDFLAKSAK